jgi:hypothetical protein
MEPERPRKMELLHTPKSELAKMMRENAIDVDEALFLCGSNKVIPGDIRTNSPSLCDRLLGMLLSYWFASNATARSTEGNTAQFHHPVAA